MKIQETICRLCLKTCESFKAIEGNIKDVLDKFLPKINLDAIQEPVVCTNCANVLIKCFDFKTACFSTHNYIVSFVNNKEDVKLDLKDVYLSKNENITAVPEDQDICAICISSVKNSFAISLNVENGHVLLRKMIEQYLPELDLRIIETPVICVHCRGSLEDFFRFVMNCLTAEEKIRKCCETLDLNSKGQIKLSSLLQFPIKNVSIEGDVHSVDKIKVEHKLCEEGENVNEREYGNGRGVFKSEPMFCDNSENVEDGVEHKIKCFIDMDDLKFKHEERFLSKNMLTCKEDCNNCDVIKMEETFCERNKLKEENLAEVEDQKYLPSEEIEIKTEDLDFNRLESSVVSSQPKVTSRLRKKQKCLMPNLKEDLSTQRITQTMVNEKNSTVTMYQCECCTFQTKYKKNLKTHLLSHKNASEVTTFKCNSCSFQAKLKNGLKKHLLVHQSPSEVTLYKCDSCSYWTKRKHNLKYHLLVHKGTSEVTMYKCDSCSFQTRYKNYLRTHLLNHKDPSEVTMYKCASCSYQTKHKHNLKIHSVIHSQVKTYGCDICSYHTKYKHSLKIHSAIHSQVKTYKCDFCLFETKQKHSLKRHQVTHKNSLK